MVENQFLERLNLLFRSVMGNTLPFGGKQVILLGDFHQRKSWGYKFAEPFMSKDPDTCGFEMRRHLFALLRFLPTSPEIQLTFSTQFHP